MAWKALEANLMASAARIVVRTCGASTQRYRSASKSPACGARSPIMTKGGSKKSRMADPSRMNSGLVVTWKSLPSRLPEADSICGTTTLSMLPGSIVLRTTTVCLVFLARNASPISLETCSTCDKSGCPPLLPGVPTQTNDIVVSRTASTALAVAVKRLAPYTFVSSSANPGSNTGVWPARNNLSLSGFASTPMTSCSLSARHTAVTEPTYPSPKTLILTVLLHRMYSGCQQYSFEGLASLIHADREGYHGVT